MTKPICINSIAIISKGRQVDLTKINDEIYRLALARGINEMIDDPKTKPQHKVDIEKALVSTKAK